MVSAEMNSPTAAVSVRFEMENMDGVAPAKKKRNLPGMPDPTAEVIALSPKSLLATNRFVCEICNKGFQRDQNLQLHRRGHNLPWKLRQRRSEEIIRKRVYVCPEASCVHHNPARALGDLTGVKKHFSRKHCEKKWKCERCCKKYAVQSDWKAHMKTCGTREYKCDCGTLFSRRDSFITHRAFCDALVAAAAAPVGSSPPPPATVLSSPLSIQCSEPPPENPIEHAPSTLAGTGLTSATASHTTNSTNGSGIGGGTSVFAGVFTSPPPPTVCRPHQFTTFGGPSDGVAEPSSLSLFLSCRASHYSPSPQPAAMSATALLQKAAQMGVTTSTASALTAGLKPMTRDLLGLGMGSCGGSGGGFCAMFTSFGGGCDVEATAAAPYGETNDL